MTTSLRALLAVLVATLGLPPARGQDAAVDELSDLLNQPVYAASKFTQTTAHAPASVTVLTAGDIRAFGWRTLGEVLNSVRGVHVRYDGGYATLGVRGLNRPGDYTSRVLVLIDGIRTSDAIYDSGFIGTEFPLDVSLIERVEYIAGPGSALYGSNAVLGVVNVVTRSAANLRGTTVTAQVATEGGRKLAASWAREQADSSWLLAASAEYRGGEDLYFPEFDSPETNDGVASGMDSHRDRKLYARYTRGEWTFSGLASERNKRIPNAPYDLVFNDPTAQWDDRIALADATWTRAWANGRSVTAHVGLGDYEYGDAGHYEPDGLLSRTGDQGRWWNGELRWSIPHGQGHRLVVGGDVQHNLRQHSRARTYDPLPTTDFEMDRSSYRAGVFASDELRLSQDVTFIAGLRADRQATGRSQVTPRLALIWEAAPGVVWKALAGTAFREPNFYERTYEDAYITANENLDRERVASREVALDWRVSERWRLAGSLYENRVADMIDQVVDDDTDTQTYRNVGGVRARGVEVESDYIASAGWRVRASLSGQHVRDDNGQRISNAPTSLAKVHAIVPWPGQPVRMGVEVLHTGRRRTLGGDTLRSHALANGTVQVEPAGARWSLSATVYNLADRAYDDPAGPEHVMDALRREGRTAALRWMIQF